nr:hypothetical protein [Vibrio parahaemolyticus]
MSRKNRSKSVHLDDGFYGQPAATVEPLHLSELKLKCDGVTAHIGQLVYKGAPNYAPKGEKNKGGGLHPCVESRALCSGCLPAAKNRFQSH